MNLNDVIDHIRNRPYMSGIERDRVRVKATGEIFTPTELVQEQLNRLPTSLFADATKTFIDPACGDGQFLGEVIIRKMEYGSSLAQALSTTYGVDLMQDNVDLCRTRLACGSQELESIVNRNIIQHDGMIYDYSFNGTNRSQADLTFDELFEFATD